MKHIYFYCIYGGLAYPTTPDINAFTPVATKAFDEEKNHLELIESLVKRYGGNLDRSVSQIKGRGVAMHWLQANPVETKDFIGIPEWVDNDSVVYLHTVEQRENITKMAEYMTKWIDSFGEDEINDWSENDICYAKFNGLYHRAEIKHVYKNEHRCMVIIVIAGKSFKKQYIQHLFRYFRSILSIMVIHVYSKMLTSRDTFYTMKFQLCYTNFD